MEQFNYDAQGCPTTHTAPKGGVTNFTYALPTGLVAGVRRPAHGIAESFAYDVMGNLLSHRMPRGGTTDFARDDLYRLAQVTGPLGDAGRPVTAFAYDLDSNVLSRTDPKGTTGWVYDKLGRLSRTTNAEGGITAFAYDREGNTRRTTDPEGNDSTFTYDSLDRVEEEIRPGDEVRTTRFAYDANSNVSERRELSPSAPARVTTFEYDSRNNLVRTRFPDGLTAEEHTPDENDNIVESTRTFGGAFASGTRMEYDGRDRVERTIGLGVSPQPQTAIDYDANGNRQRVTDPTARSTRFEYDASDRLLRTRDNAGAIVGETQYDDDDRPIRLFGPSPTVVGLVRLWTYTYTQAGELKTEANGLNQTTTHFYNLAGERIRTRDPLNRSREFDYDALGRLAEERVPVNANGLGTLTTAHEYDPNGNEISITDPRGNQTAMTYSAGNQMKTMTDPLGRVRRWDYDGFGEMVRDRHPCGLRKEPQYDALGRPVRIRSLQGGTQISDLRQEYDGNGNLVRLRDLDTGVEQRWDYDALSRMTRAETLPGGALLGRLDYDYDPAGRRTRLTDTLGQTTDYQYDTVGRLERILRNGAQHVRMQYDAAGRRRRVTLGASLPIDYTYDAAERLLRVRQDGISDISRVYDAAGNVTRQNYLHLGVQADFAYVPNAYWLSREVWTGAVNKTFQYGYDRNGNRTTAQKGGLNVGYTVDAANQLMQEEQNPQANPQPLIGETLVDSTRAGFTADVLTDALSPNTTAAGGAWRSLSSALQHFAALTLGCPEPVSSIKFWIPMETSSTQGIQRIRPQVWDGSAWVDPTGVNAVNALPAPGGGGWWRTTTGQREITFNFVAFSTTRVRLLQDANAGQPTRATEMVLNELQVRSTPGSSSIQRFYDPCGNMTRQITTGAVVQDETFQYNHDHQLTQYVRSAACGSTSFSYGYTPTADRLMKTNLSTGKGEVYLYDGSDVHADFEVAGFGSGPALAATYVQGLGTDSKWARIVGAQAHYYLPDPLGSVSMIVSPGGTREDLRLTNAWGEDMAVPFTTDRYGFTQRERDPESGMMHYRARAYDPRIGRFIQKDPVRRTAEYQYTSNNPPRRNDPLGLEDVEIPPGMPIEVRGIMGVPSPEPGGQPTPIVVIGDRAYRVKDVGQKIHGSDLTDVFTEEERRRYGLPVSQTNLILVDDQSGMMGSLRGMAAGFRDTLVQSNPALARAITNLYGSLSLEEQLELRQRILAGEGVAKGLKTAVRGIRLQLLNRVRKALEHKKSSVRLEGEIARRYRKSLVAFQQKFKLPSGQEGEVDIELDKVIIEVTEGPGKGKSSQLAGKLIPYGRGKKVIVYGKDLEPGARKRIEAAGGASATTLEELDRLIEQANK